ncbi:hypothetical protein PVK06_036076 [Gossypium arboreum]|uniref:Transposase MuDR plant domain-containing protein n=1 Tax=Gossypium arboreum TaxID=29729 RepID=A0ABR0NJM8_GOSAR|nr:hypothetical protein PVK06_036076 [Gossypium arboreum]
MSTDDALEFPNLPHRRRGPTSSSLDSGDLEVGKEFSNKDGSLNALKQYSIKNEVNYHVVKSKCKKLEAKCIVRDGTCSWKIMASVKKMTGLWNINKFTGAREVRPRLCNRLKMGPGCYNDCFPSVQALVLEL